MPGSVPSYSPVPRSSVVLFLTLSLFLRLDCKETPQDKVFLDTPYRLISSPLEASVGYQGDYSFPQQEESAFIIEDEAQKTKVWPRVILDYMRHQLRFRGRTKKSMNKGHT